jgi:nitroreductase
MKSIGNLAENLKAIVDLARLAPSVHNTQPWQVTMTDEDKLAVTLDRAHTLEAGDPTGRQDIISLGIFCEAVDMAARGCGFKVQKAVFHDNHAELHLQTHTPVAADTQAAKHLRSRSSDRSIYSPATIDQRVARSIEKASADRVKVHVTSDPQIIGVVADLTSRAMGVALSSQALRDELSEYLVRQGSGKKRGIAVGSLYINPVLGWLEPFLLKHGINLGAEAKLEKRRWESAAGLVIITAEGDMPHYWFEVGQAYLRASLAIEEAGLSQATSAAVVEASNYHEDVEELLGTQQRILAILRVGRGQTERRYSPRVPADELITSN